MITTLFQILKDKMMNFKTLNAMNMVKYRIRLIHYIELFHLI